MFYDKNEKELMKFESLEEAKEYGRNLNESKYSYLICLIKNEEGKYQRTILCQTNLAFEDELWNGARELYLSLRSMLEGHTLHDDYYDSDDDDVDEDEVNEDEEEQAGVDEASEIRDFIVEMLEKSEDVKFEYVFDEY